MCGGGGDVAAIESAYGRYGLLAPLHVQLAPRVLLQERAALCKPQ
jgi:hypothetical protein